MKEFPSWSYPLMSYKNKLYAVPNKMDILFLFSNKTLLAKNGWKTPTSYDQLANTCKQAQAKNIVCMTLGTSDIPNANEWYLTTAVNANLGNGFKKVMSGKLPLTSPGMKDTITKLNDLYNAGAIENKQSAAIPLNQAFAQFESGKALFEVAGTWLLGPWASKPPSFKLGTSVMPAWGSAKPTLPLAIGQTMLINKHSSHPEEAAEFLAWVEKPSTLNAALKPVGVPPLASRTCPRSPSQPALRAGRPPVRQRPEDGHQRLGLVVLLAARRAGVRDAEPERGVAGPDLAGRLPQAAAGAVQEGPRERLVRPVRLLAFDPPDRGREARRPASRPGPPHDTGRDH